MFKRIALAAAGVGAGAVTVATAGTALAQSEAFSRRKGVYIWGCNENNVVKSDSNERIIKTATRIPYFDDKKLRDLSISSNLCAAVLENGDVVAWGGSGKDRLPRLVLKGLGIKQVKITGNSGEIVALAKNGKVYRWREEDGSSAGTGITSKVDLPPLKWWEQIEQIDAGREHILALTSKGRVFSGSTGGRRPDKSYGQFGIATMSQFDEAPEPGRLYDIKLLKDIGIAKIAAGDFHSLLQTKDGRLIGFGDNTYGQLAIPYSYATANVAVPTALEVTRTISKDGGLHQERSRVVDIAAGGSTSYYVEEVTSSDSSSNKGPATTSDFHVYSMGNGLSGQLGTGGFAHQQRSPVRIKYFDGLREFSEKEQRVKPIHIKSWSTGTTHTAVVLDNGPPSDVLVWGGSEFAQLGNGKRSTASKPITMEMLLETDHQSASAIRTEKLAAGGGVQLNDDEVVVCGHNVTAVYTKCK